MSFKPTKFNSTEEFNQHVFKDIANSEGFNNGQIYLDGKGIATIGYGYALFVPTGNGTYALKSGIADDFIAVGKTFTDADRDRLQNICNTLNQNNKTNDQRILEARVAFNNQTFDMSFTTATGRQLFDQVITRYEDGIKNKIGETAYNNYADSQQMVALVSLAYNGGIGLIGPNLTQALKDGNLIRAWYEIRYKTNDEPNATAEGIANRRYREAEDILDQNSLTPDQAQDFQDFLNSDDPYNSSQKVIDTIRDYENNFDPHNQNLASDNIPSIDQIISNNQNKVALGDSIKNGQDYSGVINGTQVTWDNVTKTFNLHIDNTQTTTWTEELQDYFDDLSRNFKSFFDGLGNDVKKITTQIETGLGNLADKLNLGEIFKKNVKDSSEVKVDEYTVKSGDSLSSIAGGNPDKIQAIKDSNTWLNARTSADGKFILIKPGETLNIPKDLINHANVGNAMNTLLGLKNPNDTTTNSILDPLGNPVSPAYYDHLNCQAPSF